MNKTFLASSFLLATLASAAFGQSADLIIDQPALVASLEVATNTIAAGSCATVENCAGAGTRRLLKFDVGFINAGNADLVIGDPNANPDLFEFSPCHGHFHLKGVAEYELLSSSGATVMTARKQAFCLRDNSAALAGAGTQKFTCDFQGITVGWEDMYDKSLDCQWLDITGVPDGDYVLRVVCNPEGVFVESNYDNNFATASVTLSNPNPPNPPPTNNVCKCKCNCKPVKKPWNWHWLSAKTKTQWLKNHQACCGKDKSGKSKCGCQTKPGAKGKCTCKSKNACCKPSPKGCACCAHGGGKGKGKGHGEGDHDDDDDNDDHDGDGKKGDHDDD